MCSGATPRTLYLSPSHRAGKRPDSSGIPLASQADWLLSLVLHGGDRGVLSPGWPGHKKRKKRGRGQLLIYRLDRDPGEQTDLATKEPDRTAAMLKELRAWYADTQATATKQPGGW